MDAHAFKCLCMNTKAQIICDAENPSFWTPQMFFFSKNYSDKAHSMGVDIENLPSNENFPSWNDLAGL